MNLDDEILLRKCEKFEEHATNLIGEYYGISDVVKSRSLIPHEILDSYFNALAVLREKFG